MVDWIYGNHQQIDKPKSHKYFDYVEVIPYLQNKYKFDTNKSGWWEFLLGNYQIHNGCMITLYGDMIKELFPNEDENEEVKKIYEYFIQEFGKKVCLHVWW